MRNREAAMIAVALLGASACGSNVTRSDAAKATATISATGTTSGIALVNVHPPLRLIDDVALPGKANRFDYQDIDSAENLLVIAHMNDASVVIADLSTGATKKVLPNIQRARGVVVAHDVGLIFVTCAPDQLVRIDEKSLEEVGRVGTGKSPDGVGWDPIDKIVGVSDQDDGAVSLIADSGKGTRKQVPVGQETGNVVFDASRHQFWVTVVTAHPPDQLVAIDPVKASVSTRIDLPGCTGAHGLRIHPDAASAFIACEGNNKLARVDLGNAHTVVTAPTGDGPDVMSIDPGLGWLYVAAESGDIRVFDIGHAGLDEIDKEHVGDHAHSVAVDPATHRSFFPLMVGPKGTPVLRIMEPQ